MGKQHKRSNNIEKNLIIYTCILSWPFCSMYERPICNLFLHCVKTSHRSLHVLFVHWNTRVRWFRFVTFDTKIHAQYNTILTPFNKRILMLMMSKLSVSSSLSAQSSSLLLRRVGRKIAARSRKSTTFYKTGKAFASSEEGGEGKEEATDGTGDRHLRLRPPWPDCSDSNAAGTRKQQWCIGCKLAWTHLWMHSWWTIHFLKPR